LPAAWVWWALLLTGTGLRAEDKPQYEAGETKVPQAKADEPVAASVSVSAAVTYLEQGNRLWSDSRGT
jgi:hypothetical protein